MHVTVHCEHAERSGSHQACVIDGHCEVAKETHSVSSCSRGTAARVASGKRAATSRTKGVLVLELGADHDWLGLR